MMMMMKRMAPDGETHVLFGGLIPRLEAMLREDDRLCEALAVQRQRLTAARHDARQHTEGVI